MSNSQNGDSRSLYPSELRKSPRTSPTGPSLGNPGAAPPLVQGAGIKQNHLLQHTWAGGRVRCSACASGCVVVFKVFTKQMGQGVLCAVDASVIAHQMPDMPLKQGTYTIVFR